MNNKITTRLAVPNDTEAIVEIFYRGWLYAYPNEKVGVTVDDIEHRFKDRFAEDRLSKRRQFYSVNPRGGCVALVALINSEIVGVCRIAQEEKKNQIYAIYVLPDYQGRGVGKALWMESLKYFDMSKDTYVELADYNDQARKFYERLGFVDTGRRWTDEKFVFESGSSIPEMEMIIRAQSD
jgi:ribosomal protein S18 acetylase RimI-like enzyme